MLKHHPLCAISPAQAGTATAATASEGALPLGRLVALDPLCPFKSLLHQKRRDRAEGSLLPATSTPAPLPRTPIPRAGVIYTTSAHLANSEEGAGRTAARQKQQGLGPVLLLKGVQTREHNLTAEPGVQLHAPAAPAAFSAPSRVPGYPILPQRTLQELACMGTEPLQR